MYSKRKCINFERRFLAPIRFLRHHTSLNAWTVLALLHGFQKMLCHWIQLVAHAQHLPGLHPLFSQEKHTILNWALITYHFSKQSFLFFHLVSHSVASWGCRIIWFLRFNVAARVILVFTALAILVIDKYLPVTGKCFVFSKFTKCFSESLQHAQA